MSAQEPSTTPHVSTVVSNPGRAPVGAVANARNLGLLALATVWVTAQIKSLVPIAIDAASGLPVEGSAEGQQLAVIVGVAAFGVSFGFVGNIWKNIAASAGEDLSGRLGRKIGGWLP